MAVPRLKQKYLEEVLPTLKEEQYPNIWAVPRLDKVVISIGLGEAVQDAKIIESATKDLAAVAGQQPVVTKAKKSIASFRLREGMPIGLKVTLRGDRMYYFLDKLLNATLPRKRDFRGVPRGGFDGRGNYNLGISEQTVFPEIDYAVDKVRGLQITIVTTAQQDKEAERLLELLGMPFARS